VKRKATVLDKFDGRLLVIVDGKPVENPKKKRKIDSEFVCAIYTWNPKVPSEPKQIGRITLPSRRSSTFPCARKAIQQLMDSKGVDSNAEWSFFLPGLYSVSLEQEANLRPIVKFFRKCKDCKVGDGSIENPVNLLIRLN
jgi:hypothetical protein